MSRREILKELHRVAKGKIGKDYKGHKALIHAMALLSEETTQPKR